MRVLLALAVIALGLTGAHAGNLDKERDYFATGYRCAPLTFDDERSGVRAYWLEPWGNRHYFPVTGKRPRIGRHENLAAVSRPSKPAQTFRRSWSNAGAFAHELSRPGRDDGMKRVIQADAEIAELGSDSVNIRLRRKGSGSPASADAE